MKTTSGIVRTAARCLTASVAVWVAGTVQGANVVHYTNGKTQTAKSITWRPSAEEYRVVTMEDTIIPVAAKDVDSLEIDKPADFDKAQKMVESGQFDTAIPLLEGMVESYKMINWDNKARELLAKAFMAKKDPGKAVTVMEEMIKTAKPSAITPALRRTYWEALIGANRQSTLKKELEETIFTGTPEMAAMAQLTRGNMNRAQGLKEDALLDYLRTVILFSDVKDKDIQGEALFNAAAMLDDLRDPRAAELRKRLLRDYPDSKFAKSPSAKE